MATLAELEAIHQEPAGNASIEELEAIHADEGIKDTAILEAVGSIASGAAMSAVAGYAGMASMPFVGAEGAADIVKDIQSTAFQPKTEGGKAAMQKIGELAKSGLDVANASIGQLVSLAGFFAGKSDDEQFQIFQEVKEKGISNFLGGSTLEATGSPLAATAAHMFPEAISSVAGFKGAKAIPEISKEAGELVSDLSRFQTPRKQEIARQIQAGEIDADIAKYRISQADALDDIDATVPELPRPEPTARQKALGADLPQIVKDVKVKKAAYQGFDSGFLDAVKKRGTPADKRAMLEMTQISQKGKKDPLYESDFRPADVAGNTLLNDINEIKRINKAAGRQIGDAKKYLSGKKVPTAHIGDSFIETLDSLGIKIEGNKLDYSDSIISGLGGRKKAINGIWGKMVKNKDPDAMDLHNLKREIDESISYGKNIGGLGGDAEAALRSLRTDINETLKSNFPRYAEANKAYSDTIDALDEIQRLAGQKTDLTSNSASGSLGVLSRRLTSNAQSRGQVRDSYKQIGDVLRKHEGFGDVPRIEGPGGTGKPNLKLLMLYADELDKIVGTPAKTSLTGSIGTALEATTGKVDMIGAALKMAKKGAGINQDKAYKSITEFLKAELK